MARTRSRIATNALANYAGQISTLAVGILLTPLIVSRLGSAMYGLWVLVVAVQGLAGLVDFGVTDSVIKYVAEHEARGEIDEINRVVSSSFFLHLILGTLAFAATAALAVFGLPLLQLDAQQIAVARPALLVAGGSLLFGLPLGVLGGLLTGLRQYERSNAVNIAQTLITAGAMVVALQLGGGPVALVAINGVGLAGAYLTKGWLAGRALPGLRLRPSLVGGATLRRIGAYSIWLFVLGAATRIFYNADAVLIAGFLPVRAVTAYNLGFKPANAVSYLSGPFVAVFFPAAAALQARTATRALRRLLILGTRLALVLTLPAVLWLLTFGRQALTVWVGTGHDDALPVLYIFLAVFLVSATQNPAGTILRGTGRVRALALLVIVEYVANIGLSLLLIPRIGVAGAALGTLIPAVVNDLAVIPWLCCRMLNIDVLPFLRITLLGPLLAAVPALALLWPLSAWLAAPSLVSITVGGLLAALSYGAGYYVLGASRGEKRLLRAKIRQITGRA